MALPKAQVKAAVNALQSFSKARTTEKEIKLESEEEKILLIVALKRIPASSPKPKRIPLLHSLYGCDRSSVCLFTKDGEKTIRELFDVHGVDRISEIIPVKKVKKEYSSYESRRRLCAQFDLFLVDDRVWHCMPRLLGKHFYEKKKRPIAVNLRKKDLKREIGSAVDSTYLYLGRGACSCVPVAYVSMPAKQIVANICHAASSLSQLVPRHWANVLSINVKTTTSAALPLYSSLPDAPKVLNADEESAKVILETDTPAPPSKKTKKGKGTPKITFA